jgi:photosystem II stability/assembly factor-like uncharacterized protein
MTNIPGGPWLKIHTPTPDDLLDVWEDGHGIVWAVGRFGTVLRCDGARVERVDLGHHGVDFQAIHGSSPEDIWIVGDEGVVLHFNGADWVERPITSHVRWLMDVWVTPGGNVWAVGSAYEYVDDGSGFYPVAHLWDGAQWNYTPLPESVRDTDRRTKCTQLEAVHGTDGDLYAVGTAGGLFHHDGSEWSSLDSGVDYYLFDVLRLEDKSGWIIGDHDLVLHRPEDTETWNVVRQGQVIGAYANMALAACAPEVWIAGYWVRDLDDSAWVLRWDGAAWSDESPGLPSWLNGLFCSSDGTLWAVGTDGTLITRPRP